MKIRWLFLVCWAVTWTLTAAAPTRPNVILIVSDDQGSVDAGCYGANDLSTPHLDQLAARGVRFSQFYAAAPVCSPSRAAILTGRYPQRVQVTGNAPSQPGGAGGLPPSEITIAERLRESGYATAHVGKWHLGYTPPRMPNAQGFDHSFGHMGGCIDNWSHFFYWAGPNVHDLHRNGVEVHAPGQFFPDLLVREATEFMQRHRDRPFFLYFALNLPHYPYQGDVRWLERFRHLPYPRNLYAAFMASADERIGALLKQVDALGLRGRTVVIFQSDNGHSVEERAHFGGGNAGPHRGAKFSLFEGGIRVPAMISWPGHLPEGAERDQVAFGCDWMPTILELCGASPATNALDGRSLLPVIRSRETPSPHGVLHWQTGPPRNPLWAVRSGPWKLLGNPLDNAGPKLEVADARLFLANILDDPGETKNVAAQHPEIVARLQRLHEEWLREVEPR